MSDERPRGLIPEGTYRACADRENVCWGESNAGNEQLAVPFRIRDTGPALGKTILWIRSFGMDAKQAEITDKGLTAAGWDGVSLRTLDGLGSCDVDIVIVHTEYEGKWRAELKYINKPGASGFEFKKPLLLAKLDALDARFARMRGRGPAAQQSASPSRDDGPPGDDPREYGSGGYGNDDDIPF